MWRTAVKKRNGGTPRVERGEIGNAITKGDRVADEGDGKGNAGGH